MIHVTNGKIFSDKQANYSKELPYIWNEIPVLLTFESNWEKAKKLSLEIMQKHSLQEVSGLGKDTLDPTNRLILSYAHEDYTGIEPSGILLTLRYLCPVRKEKGFGT